MKKSMKRLFWVEYFLVITKKFFKFCDFGILCTDNIIRHLYDLRSLRYLKDFFCHMYCSLMMFDHIIHKRIIEVMI